MQTSSDSPPSSSPDHGGDGARGTAEGHDPAAHDRRILGIDDRTDPFVAAVRATRMPMIITDPLRADNPVVFANEAFSRLTGYERDEILGRNCRFLQGPDSDPAVVRQLSDAVRTRQSVQVDIRNYRKNGEPFWNRLLMAPVFDANGRAIYFFASQVDVTTERERLAGLETTNAALQAEVADRTRAAQASEARLMAAADAGGIGVWELDIATLELYASRHCKSNFGRDVDAPFAYAELLEAVHPNDRERMRAAVAHTIASGEDYRIEYRIVRPDGQLAWVRIHARLERDAQGRPWRLIGTSQDHSDAMLARRRSEILLSLEQEVFGLDDPTEIAYRAAEALGRALDVSRAGYGTIVKADETIVIDRDWNAPGIKTLAGTLHFRDYGSYIEDLKAGRTVVIEDARRDPRTRETADALAAISAQAFINMPVTEAGGLVALLYLNHATARHWSADEQSLVHEVAQRVRQAVERRRAENDLRTMAAGLEQQVKERTAELMRTEEALRQSQKMEAVGQLTGGLAHDFNNLLAAISGSLELLKRKLHQEDLQKFVEMGQTATRRAAALTHRLLAFSRRQTLEPKAIDINRLIAGFEELVRRTIGPQIALEVVKGIAVWTVHADPTQLESALLNLCINARDAMPDGGRLVIETANRYIDERTGAEQGMSAGQYVSICVSDNGVGMSPDVAAHAFDPFFTTKPIGVGTGLGLSMVYGFVRQSEGYVRIYSELGQGTNVCLYLPRHLGAAESIEEAPSQARAMGLGQWVLVVDDEAAIRALIREELHDLGYRVLEAADGQEALATLRSTEGVQLLITDVGLPGGMNGRQVADAARELLPNIQVLFVTGYAENAVLSHGHLAPGMHVMTKPFEMAAFGQKVRALIAG